MELKRLNEHIWYMPSEEELSREIEQQRRFFLEQQTKSEN